MRFVAAVFCLIVITARASAKLRLSVPADLSDPRPAPVRMSGLVPHARVTISTTLSGEDGQTFVAETTFCADGKGRVDTATQRPIAGSYKDIEPLGLFWSAAPRKTKVGDPAPGAVRVSAEESIGEALLALRLYGNGAPGIAKMGTQIIGKFLCRSAANSQKAPSSGGQLHKAALRLPPSAR